MTTGNPTDVILDKLEIEKEVLVLTILLTRTETGIVSMKVVKFGCGPIGCSVVRYASRRPDIEVVGAIDISESLVGQDLGEVAGLGKKLGVSISNDIDAVLSQNKPDAESASGMFDK